MQVTITEGQCAPHAPFMAPMPADALDGLIGEYRSMRKRIDDVASFAVGDDFASVLPHFVGGNTGDPERGHSINTARLFSAPGAIASLNSTFWQRALDLTDVLDLMPTARRNEWHKQVRELKCPEFTEETVRATLGDMLHSRGRFFAERVDGIFRALSGEHVTNRPEGFSKRMIVAGVLNEYGHSAFEKTGFIHDLRCVIATILGWGAPASTMRSDLIHALQRYCYGEWVELDGGALRIRLYKKGTAHMEVHPDVAWQLNKVLASIYPLAIPAAARSKPRRLPKDVHLMHRPLPGAVLAILAGMRRAVNHASQPAISNSLAFDYYDTPSQARDEAEQVLAAVGGTRHPHGYWLFDYDPRDVVRMITVTGSMPDAKAHQFYPTPAGLAARLVAMADIQPGHAVLEPSAGVGALADAMPQGTAVTCVEVSALHCAVLEAKGYNTVQGDFLTYSRGVPARFDRVAMNPPFADGRAAAHVETAAALVKPGGLLVAILPSGMRGRDLPGFACTWSKPMTGEFPGVSVAVVTLVARKEA